MTEPGRSEGWDDPDLALEAAASVARQHDLGPAGAAVVTVYKAPSHG
jgi:hypothetical protein